jgi:hypothetical protein
MSTLVWVVIAVVVVVVVGLVFWRALAARRTRALRERFGPEYDRTATKAGSKHEAETELASRQERREQLNIRSLPAETRRRYAQRWEAVQAQFVDSPTEAVSAADDLVSSVMAERGYPVDDFEQRAADVSVDHPDVVQNYRQAHQISQASNQGQASTEDLRQAMQNYRALFDELLDEDSADQPVGRDNGTDRAVANETKTKGSVR